jgi:hypothetical protein
MERDIAITALPFLAFLAGRTDPQERPRGDEALAAAKALRGVGAPERLSFVLYLFHNSTSLAALRVISLGDYTQIFVTLSSFKNVFCGYICQVAARRAAHRPKQHRVQSTDARRDKECSA